GNYFGILGMATALVVATVVAFDTDVVGLGAVLLVVAVVVGAGIGLQLARTVEMTGMPEPIALLHSFVGLAAVLVGWNGSLHIEAHPDSADTQVLEGAGLLG
ncbi:NAD(P)(+) transhydrogenase (Re/Si-specific) subunit beta, partial [Nocardioides sp. R-C-SC26]|uniref:NAD(P)(+) transhydrogenase (Re/Si-specific) subunit beta n=1 Tax=Nocardioides sp. R-C-SC26 TaxID=2870414 RepID=UPI001E3FB7CE